MNARYVYGVSATPVRSDSLEKINFFLLGPVRHKYTALERTAEQGIDYLVYPRYTRTVDFSNKTDTNAAYALISENADRNRQIAEDIRACVKTGRNPVILTRYKEQARLIYGQVQDDADAVFLLYGDQSAKENEEVRRRLKELPPEKTMILIATGQKIGEGFDCPRLDTLMLAAPVSFAGRLEQYVGRLSREYGGKKRVVVYDYIDAHIPVFEGMYRKRLKTYKKIGFRVISDPAMEKQEANAIYDAESFADVFERDLVEADREIVISSPDLISEKVDRLIRLVKPRQEAGVTVTVITDVPENNVFGNAEYLHALTRRMQAAGIRVLWAEEPAERFAVMDRVLVWHGGVNLLGKEDAWGDGLIRVRDEKAAAELMEMGLAAVQEN